MSAGAIRVPDSATKYILLQRTGLQRLHALTRFLRVPYYPHVCSIEAVIRRAQIKREYIERIMTDYQCIAPFLPESASRILDIGCGVAALDVFLHHHYGAGRPPEFFLLDKTEVNPTIIYGFRPAAAFYNSLEVARLTLTLNGVSESNIRLLTPKDMESILPARLSLVISLLAWGFHFPISTYLNRVHSALSDGGRIIVDLRKGSDGEAPVARTFSHYQVILEDSGFKRVVAVK